MGIGDPLRGAAAHAGEHSDIGAQGAAADDQPPITEGIFDPLHHTADLAQFLPRDAGAVDPKIDDLRNRKQTNGYGYQRDRIPEEKRTIFA